MATPHLANFSLGERVIGVVAIKVGKSKAVDKPGLALCQEITEALVGVFGCSKPANWRMVQSRLRVHRGMNARGCTAARQESDGRRQDPNGAGRLGVQPADRMPGNRREFGLSFRTFFQRRLERVLLPGLFFGGRSPTFRRCFQWWSGLRASFGLSLMRSAPGRDSKNRIAT